ncbi:MAG: hypothetical protein FE834_06420, partial [Gammaproteobacteria bacterium]|nr:hypothetical protein [Gammaproteobacteria bacterium]
SYVIFGKTNTTAINLSEIVQGTGGFVINGEKAGNESGRSVSSAGDVNGDGLDDLIVGAYGANKSYVIFGKTNTTAINLSTIANDTGGFVINGESTGDQSGRSVSSAGDVNGDGLDDLIVGVLGSNSSAGKSYVIFGKTDTNAINLSQLSDDSKYSIDFQGTTGDDNLGDNSTTNKNELFVAGAGNDILTGNGGMDVFSAGAGNDTIIINASNIAALEKAGAGNRARINGGGGIDTLQLASDSAGLMLDLTKISNNRIQNIEKIDITGSGDNTLKLSLHDLLNASGGTKMLKILGNSGDTVNVVAFSKTSSQTEASITYDVYTHDNVHIDTNVALWIQTGITVVDVAPDAVDLDAATGVQNTSTAAVSLAQIGTGIAFDAQVADVTATDIKSIKVVLDGANLNTVNDKLLLDIEIGLNVNTNITGRTIDTVGGLKYTYTASSKTLLITKMTGVFNAADVAKVVEGIQLKNTDSGSQRGIRTATLSYIDIDRNESASAIASLEVDIHRGFVMNGEAAGDVSGISVSSAGDVNGDGLDDLIVGARWADPTGGTSAGKSYVIFGKTNTTAINLSNISNGTGGFVINGEARNDLSGFSVSSAGDVNGDGLDDLIVGAYGADSTGGTDAGKSYIIFGKTNTTAINLSTIANGTGGFVLNGEAESDTSGIAVSSAGDVNGDGLDDLIVGAMHAGPTGRSSGKSYVVFGKTNTTAINLSTIVNGTGGFVINGEAAGDWSGESVSSAGDVNGDGLDDLIVGASGGSKAGKSYVIFGKTNTTAINLSTIANGTGGFVINGEATNDRSGWSVSSAGDVNGDGLDDLIVGARDADPTGGSKAGKSYVIFGKTNTTAINLSTIANGTGGFVINGEATNDRSGWSVSSAGDVNGDGLDDLIV